MTILYIMLQSLAKLIFFPVYLFLMLVAIIFYMFGLAVHAQTDFKEILEVLQIDGYWDYELW